MNLAKQLGKMVTSAIAVLIVVASIGAATAQINTPSTSTCDDVTKVRTSFGGTSGTTQDITMNGETFTFEVVRLNGEWFLELRGERMPLEEGSQQRLNGIAVTLTDVFTSSIPTPQASVTLEIDTDFYTAFVEMGEETQVVIDGASYVLEIQHVSNSAPDHITILVNGNSYYVHEGDRFSVGSLEFIAAGVFTTSIPVPDASASLIINPEFSQAYLELNQDVTMDICGNTIDVELNLEKTGLTLTVDNQVFDVVESENIFVTTKKGTVEFFVQDLFDTTIPVPDASITLHAELHKAQADYVVEI